MKSDTRKGSSKVEVTCRKVSSKVEVIYILMALSSIKTCRDFYLMSVAVPDQKKKTHRYRFCAL